MRQYRVVEEWVYPTEIGRDVVGNYDTREDALAECERLADVEYDNYQVECGDADYPQRFAQDGDITVTEGWIITPQNGLDEWYYSARAIEIQPPVSLTR